MLEGLLIFRQHKSVTTSSVEGVFIITVVMKTSLVQYSMVQVWTHWGFFSSALRRTIPSIRQSQRVSMGWLAFTMGVSGSNWSAGQGTRLMNWKQASALWAHAFHTWVQTSHTLKLFSPAVPQALLYRPATFLTPISQGQWVACCTACPWQGFTFSVNRFSLSGQH